MRSTRKARAVGVTALAAALMIATTSMASALGFGPWSAPVSAEAQVAGTSTELNTTFTDGCPILSPDGLSLYMASNRDGGLGGLDIWVAHRADRRSPWGAPQNLGAPINSSVDDFCPTPVVGGGLFFVSARMVDGACGGPDIYYADRHGATFGEPHNLGCEVNSPAIEAGPSLVTAGRGARLYFSSTRVGGFSTEPDGATSGDADLYVSRLRYDGFGTAVLVPVLNSAANDARPNVRRDGEEIVFDSDRPGTLGGPDIYAAFRVHPYGPWSEPANLGPTINTASSESRASLSRFGRTMVFGSNRPGSEAGSNDIYITTRRPA